MPELSKRRPRDANELARQIVEEVTEQERATDDGMPEKDPAAIELGRRGGLKGGTARAAKLGPAERKEIARKAAEARRGSQKSR